MTTCGYTHAKSGNGIVWPLAGTCITETSEITRRSLVPLRGEGSESVPAMIDSMGIIYNSR